MKVDRRLMAVYRKDPDKVREIFETAKNTDMDREEAREHIYYLGNDDNREDDKKSNLIMAGFVPLIGGPILSFSGVSPGPIILDPAILGIFLGSGMILYSLIRTAYSHEYKGANRRFEKYKSAREDALRNLARRNESVQVLEEVK